jgi:SAM-dependent methyltransferase
MTEVTDKAPSYVCPACHGALATAGSSLACGQCRKNYPISFCVADFSESRYYDTFTPGQALSESDLEGLRNEIPGVTARIRDYYFPLLQREGRAPGRSLRVLDSGCGNGLSVDLLTQNGLDGWGVDLSALRKWQWRERIRRDRLACADSLRLPFPEGFFDAVLCSGVLEHVGVRESRTDRYRVSVLKERDSERIRFLREHARVLAPGGVLWLDFPNGACPIDFWHSSRAGTPRWHSRNEGFLPTVAEIRRYSAALPGRWHVTPRGPAGRLQFHQVSRHWYGKLLARPMALWLRLLGVRPFSALIATGLNPYLVLELRRER